MRLSNQFALAERLGKTLAEVRQMPEAEFAGWCAWFAAKAEMAKEKK